MKKNACMVFILIAAVAGSSYADNAQMNETLVKVIQELQAIKPLLETAAKQQDKNPRIKVHFENFTGSDGAIHEGLKTDINRIQQSIIAIIDQESIEPRSLAPIKGDFIDKDKV